jgi:hypothetical protein
MDPYEILGIPGNATREEIKKAYRKEAMKWHPDRCDNSAESLHRFQQAANAYRILSENYVSGGHGDSGRNSSAGYQYQQAESGPSAGSADSRADTEDSFADSVFWEVMLDFAIKLAQGGMRESEISNNLAQNGCPGRLAAIIADKAFNIHAHYASNPGRKRQPGADRSTFKEDRLEVELQRAFIGRRNLLLSPKDTIDYYLVVFSEFRQSDYAGSLFKINPNRRLMRILSFSILLFAVMAFAIDNFPGPSEYKLLPDIALLQLPLAVLSLMFIWTIYRRLWIFSLIFWLLYLATLVVFNSFAPQALGNDLTEILTIAAICYAPFVFIALFANYFYYRKAQATIGLANQLFEDQQDKIIWIKNRAGTSNAAAFAYLLVILSSLLYLTPGSERWLNALNLNLLNIAVVKDDATRKARLRLEDAGQFFEIAETHFNHSPPDYMKASMAYSNAADNGSLLAAYKLGYMHYSGEGVEQSDVLALEYFEMASRAPLAFQPHSLALTTEYLAEAYNNLGIMYQSGYGTGKDLKTAIKMYRKGAEFGSENAKRNLLKVNEKVANGVRKRLLNPDYE